MVRAILPQQQHPDMAPMVMHAQSGMPTPADTYIVLNEDQSHWSYESQVFGLDIIKWWQCLLLCLCAGPQL
jgi:hypothetical protein